MKLPLLFQHKKKDADDECLGNLQIMQDKLARNCLTEFTIGFEEDEVRSECDLESLIKTIEKQYFRRLATDKISVLESIRIGSELPFDAEWTVLEEIVPLLLRPPAKVKRLQITVDCRNLPPTLERLISRTTLETLELHSTRLPTRCESPISSRHPITINSASQSRPVPPASATTKAVPSEEQQVASYFGVLGTLRYLPNTLTTLKLNDRNLEAEDVAILIQLLRTKIHVRVLGLRDSGRLYMNGWEHDLIEKLPFLTALDLSSCNFDSADGMRLAAALTRITKSKLQSLNVADNWRLRESIPELVKACSQKGIIELDCSVCGVEGDYLNEIFEFLATDKQCSIRSLKMPIVGLKNPAPLIQCIETNTSLERLITNHPYDFYSLTPYTMDKIAVAIRNNYYLQVLQVHTVSSQDPKVLKEIEHWLTLNRCGRSILLHDKSRCRYWSQVLARAASSEDLDIFYWMLRNGTEHFAIS